MKKFSHIAGIMIIVGLTILLLTACPKRNETSPPGPGGLPRGIVQQGQSPEVAVEYPIYPGAVKRATGVYESTALISDVRDYYIDLLGIQPEIRDENREVFTFVTAEYTLVLLPMAGTPGGTEINFEVSEEE